MIDAPASLNIQGQELANSGGSAFGEIDVTTALTNSVNTFFAKLGRRVGEDTLYEYMDRFGFNSKPDIDLPPTQVATSGVFDGTRAAEAGEGVDISRIAIGQERLLATPIQMAEVAAAIANDGDLMKPRIWDEVRDVDGRSVDTMDPSRQSEVMSEETAAELTEAMKAVVNEGTGTAAALSGIDVAGKTGTAEVPGTRGLRGAAQPGLVRRLRSGRRPADCGRGDGRVHRRTRRYGCGSDRRRRNADPDRRRVN